MKTALLLVMSLTLPQVLFAQEDSSAQFKNEINKEIDGIYPKAPKAAKRSKKIVVNDLGEEERPSSTTIINNNLAPAESDQQNVQQQPPTYVEATPLKESRTDLARKNRMELEKNTEDKLLEKIEQNRVESEKERSRKAEHLFEKQFDEEKEKDQEKPAPVVVAPAPVPVVQPTPAPVIANDKPLQVEIVKGQLEEVKEKEKPVEPKSAMYVSALGGFPDYADSNNVKGKYSVGVATGFIFPERIVLEGSYVYSRFDVTEARKDSFYPTYYYQAPVQMNQHNIAVAGKYMFLDSRVRPLAGVLLSYTYRTFEDKNNTTGYGYGTTPRQGNRPSSSAFDAGLLVGADVKVSDSFSIGTDFRYIFNLSYTRESDPSQYGYYGVYSGEAAGKPVEEFAYYLFTLSGTFRF